MELFESILSARRRGERVVLCTVVRTHGSVPRHAGAKMLVYEDGACSGTIGGGEMEHRTIAAARQVLQEQRPRLVRFALHDPDAGDAGVCGGEVEIFMDPLSTRPTLVVIGAGHVGRALVHLGAWLGFRVVVADDRPEHCTPEATPGADEYLCAPIAALPQRLHFDADTWVVMPTRGMAIDVEALPHLLDATWAYLGVIGSRRRWLAARQALEARGVERHKLERVRSPMGLDLQAETPEEIALAVLGEIVMLRNGGSGAPMHAKRPATATAADDVLGSTT